MPRDKRKVEEALAKKGFERKEGDHHRFIYRTLDGKKTAIITKTSHTPKMKEIPDNLLAQMAKQCGVTKSQFSELLDCPLCRKGYETILVGNGKL
ncbi:MAG TPA: hypothetical protein DCZ48_13535 [Methylococcaceae bacterium]|nr:hypothetical protein [Methylococcaceae bacterium]